MPRTVEVENLQAKINQLRDEMQAGLIERDEEVDVVLISLLCGENPLLVGPPGTAKSMLLDSLLHSIGGASKFTILLNKFTTPEEVFGPISVQGLKQDIYRRVTDGKLPQADIAFVDEIFKASTAILNTMLKILNEHTYSDGGGSIQCPLLMAVAASNEWPNDQDGGKELGALFDRFLIRKVVHPIRSQIGLDRLLWGKVNGNGKTKFTREQVLLMRDEVADVQFSDLAKETMVNIIGELRKEGIKPGDRRLRKSIGACKAAAYLDGSDEVHADHLEILSHILWDDPNEQPDKCAKVVGKYANPIKMKVADILMQANDVVVNSPLYDAGPKLKELGAELRKLVPSLDSQRELIDNALEEVGELAKEVYRKSVAV